LGSSAGKLDPLGQYLLPAPVPELNFDGEAAEEAKGYYCGSIGVEFMHLPDAARREWIQERMEQVAPAPDQRQVLERLTQADLFEQVIQSRYLGTKRFSLEGVTVLIPFLDEILNRAADHGAIKSVMGMSHRGRLNVMANTFGKSPPTSFQNSKMPIRAASWAAVT
jgi:2-oxoglutarate dehydrogenase E1 component